MSRAPHHPHPQRSTTDGPFDSDPYFRTIKIRSGAWAILMAFDELGNTPMSTKKELMQKGAKHCDEQMDVRNQLAGSG